MPWWDSSALAAFTPFPTTDPPDVSAQLTAFVRRRGDGAARRLLRRSSFRSLEALRERIESFLSYFNETLAKPYRWTFTGRALAA